MATVERTLTINVRKQVIKVPAYRRAKKAVTAVREFLQQHMKSDNVKLGKYLNLKLWEHGIKNPTMRVTVVAKKDDKGMVTAELPSIPVKKQKPVKAKTAKKAAGTKAATTTAQPAPAKAEEKATVTASPAVAAAKKA